MLVDRSGYVAEEEEGEGWRWTADDFFDPGGRGNIYTPKAEAEADRKILSLSKAHKILLYVIFFFFKLDKNY